MAKRWRLSAAGSLADIGCGLGHWSRLLFRYLAPGARLVGIDRETAWIAQAPALFRREYPEVEPERVQFVAGDALSLPLADNTHDVVTCQTLLIHLAEPAKALAEMVRVASPGGLIICVEPNNLINAVASTSLAEQQPVEQVVRHFEFWLRFERGKTALGEGNNSLGDLLPGLFVQAGLTDLHVCQSDQTEPYFPPYDTVEQRTLLAQADEWCTTGTGPWNREVAHRNVLAGGGSEEFFEACWQQLQQTFAEERAAIRENRFFAAGGGTLHLVAGRKYER